MAWTETYSCDVCGKAKSEEFGDWWLAWSEKLSPTPRDPEQPVLKILAESVVDRQCDDQGRHSSRNPSNGDGRDDAYERLPALGAQVARCDK